MAKPPTKIVDDTTPKQFPEVTPPDLYATSDIRFVMLEIGKLGAKIDHLSDAQSSTGEKVDKVLQTVDRVKMGLIVGGIILSAVLSLFWWAIGDRIENAARRVLTDPAYETRLDHTK